MSSKSKRPGKRWSPSAQRNRDLLVFVWAWVSVAHPSVGQILAVKEEILNVCESLRLGTVTESMIVEQLEAEHGLRTDWQRRDRG